MFNNFDLTVIFSLLKLSLFQNFLRISVFASVSVVYAEYLKESITSYMRYFNQYH